MRYYFCLMRCRLRHRRTPEYVWWSVYGLISNKTAVGENTIITQTFLGEQPGRRLDNYRNSIPRYIKIFGVGNTARNIVERFSEVHRDNILTASDVDPGQMQALDNPVDGIRPNAIIVVYKQGEPFEFPFHTDRTGSMLSFIVLESPIKNIDEDASRKIREIKRVADLFVTTTDPDYVGELVENLAS